MNFFIYLISEGLSKIIPFVSILVIAKFINVESFGELTLYYIIYEFLLIIISNNITATTRIDYFKLSKLDYTTSKTVHLVVSFFLFLFISIIALFVPNIPYKFVLILSLSALLRTVSYYTLSDLQCKEDARSYAISNLIYIFGMNITFLILIVLYHDIYSWFYSILFGAFIQFIYSIIHIKKYILIKIESSFSYAILNKYLLLKEFKNGLIFMPQAIGFWMKLGIDRILLAKFTSTLVVGHYMFAFQLSWPIMILSTAINLYITPKINKMLKENNINAIKKLLQQFSLLIIVFSVLIYLVSTFIIHNFYYAKYNVSLEYIPYIIVAILFQSIMMIYLNIFYYINKKEFVSKFVFFTSIIQVIFGFFFISFFGIYGLLIFNILFSGILFVFIINKLVGTFKNAK
jgi:O-antigen/teichoic acid export membrane protein